MGKTIDLAEAARRLGVDPSRVRVLCRERRIPRARLVGRSWLIPDDFEVIPAERGPRPSYVDREMARDPAKLALGRFELDCYVSEDAKRLVVKRNRTGSITKTQAGRLIAFLQGLHDQMIG